MSVEAIGKILLKIHEAWEQNYQRNNSNNNNFNEQQQQQHFGTNAKLDWREKKNANVGNKSVVANKRVFGLDKQQVSCDWRKQA